MVTFFSNDVHPLGSSCVDHCSRRSGLVRLPEAPGFCLDSSRRIEGAFSSRWFCRRTWKQRWAGGSQRVAERAGYRHGWEQRKLTLRTGTVQLEVPRARRARR